MISHKLYFMQGVIVMRLLSCLADLGLEGEGRGQHIVVIFQIQDQNTIMKIVSCIRFFTEISDKNQYPSTFSFYINEEQNNMYQCHMHILNTYSFERVYCLVRLSSFFQIAILNFNFFLFNPISKRMIKTSIFDI